MEFKEMLQKVANTLDLTPDQILQPCRERTKVEARLILYLLLDEQNEHVTEIAARFNQCRTTVIHGLAKANSRLKYDRYFKTKYHKCALALQEDTG